MATFSTLTDDFEDGVLGAAWAPSYGTISEANGRARILSENGYPGLRSESAYSLIDDSITIRAIPAPLGDATASTTSEVLIDSPTGGTRLLIAVDVFSGNIQFRSDVGYGDGGGVSIPYDATAHAWWRFRETGGTVFMETSPDASTWTIQRQVPTPAWITAGSNPLHFSTHRETGSLATYYFEVDSVNVLPAASPVQLSKATLHIKGSTGSWVAVTWRLVGLLASHAATVNFANVLPNSLLSDISFGSCISTYSGDGQNVNIIKGTAEESGAWKATLGELGPMAWRIPLAWNGGTPGSSAGGARTTGDAADYVLAIRDIGGTPIVAVGGTTGDNDILAADAANLVHFFNDNGGQNGGPIKHWIIGNEPDNGFGVDNYINGSTDVNGVKVNDSFNAIVDAMRAATTETLEIAGPSLVTYADYKEGDYNAFFDACGDRIDVVDFHMYDGANVDNYTAGMNWLQSAIDARASMAGRVKIHLGEYNWHPYYEAGTVNGAESFWTSKNTIAGAQTIGRIVNKGGRAYQYSDNNGPLGLITPGDGTNGAPEGYRIPTPSYYGIKMWTGGDLFRQPTGSMATCSTSLAGIEVYASTGDKNIVVINTGTATQTVDIGLEGGNTTGTYEIFQTVNGTDPTDPLGAQFQDPQKITAGNYAASTVTVTAPAGTVSTIVLDPPPKIVLQDATIETTSTRVVPYGEANPYAVTPAGTVEGDVLLFIYATDYAATGSPRLAVPAGFTELSYSSVAATGAKMITGWKRATANEPANQVFTKTTDGDGQASILRISGVSKEASPAVTFGLTPSSKTTHSIPTTTPNSDRGLHIGAVAKAGSAAGTTFVWTEPAGFTEHLDNDASGWIGYTLASRRWDSASATGAQAFGLTTSATASAGMAVSIVFPSGQLTSGGGTTPQLLAAKATNGSGGQKTDQQAILFQATQGAQVSSRYHRWASHLTGDGPYPLVIHLHGDGGYEYDNPTTWTSPQYMQVAKDINALGIIPNTPDTSSGYRRWWEGYEPTYWLVDLIAELKRTYNIDENRMFISGFSGGAVVTTSSLVADWPEIFGGGGAMMLGGGGAYETAAPVPAGLQSQFYMRWHVGDSDEGYNDDGTIADDGYDAITDAQQGEAKYRADGWNTAIELIPGGIDHLESEEMGPSRLQALVDLFRANHGF